MHRPYIDKIAFILGIVLAICSCTPTLVEVVALDGEQYSSDNRVEITARFGIDAGDHLVFELDLVNGSDAPFDIDAQHVMLMIDDELTGTTHRLPAMDKDRFRQHLLDEQEVLRKEQRTRGVFSAIGVGLGVVAMAVDPGSFSTTDRIFYAAEATAGIVGEQRSFQLARGDIDDQILYVDDWVLDVSKVDPNEEQSWDLLFANPHVAGPATLLVELDNRQLEFDFQLALEERRY